MRVLSLLFSRGDASMLCVFSKVREKYVKSVRECNFFGFIKMMICLSYENVLISNSLKILQFRFPHSN